MKRWLLVGLLVAANVGLFCGTSYADNITVISASTIDLDHVQSRTFSNIPPIDPGTKRVKLCFKMRCVTSGTGFSYGVNFYLNGTKIIGAESRLKTRLLNKPLMGVGNAMWQGVIYDWNRYCRPLTGWVTILHTSYASSSSKAWLIDPQWPIYELAVEDLVVSDQNNTLRIDNDHGSLDMIIDDLTIGVYDEPGFGDIVELPAFPDRLPRRTPSFAKPNASVNPSDGGLEIILDNQTYRIESLFSYPGGGYNLLGPGPSPESSQTAFINSISVTQVDGDTWTVTAGGADYSLIRRVTRWDNGKIHVQDNITNTSGADLGLIVKHYLKFDGRVFQHALMGGNPDASLNNVGKSANPTLYVPLSQGGLGLVAEDDFFRLQNKCFYDYIDVDGTGIKTEHLMIPPGQSYPMEWSVYAYQDPDGYGDYFDFVNLVRNDWGTNFTIQGPYTFQPCSSVLQVSDAALAAGVAANNTYALIFWCSFKYNDQWWSYCSDFFWGKPGTLFSAWNDTVNAAIAKLRNAVPQLKILPFINSSLNILDQIEQFPDSQLRDQDGNLFYYPGNGDHGWLVLTTQTNSYGQALADMITSLIEEYQVDGLYWDEFSGAGYGDNLLIPHSTFNASDNHTALVDPITKQIVITAAKTRIVTAPWTMETLDRLKGYDAPLITNSAPVTKAFSDLEVPRFVETHANIDRTYESNLYSPLCLTNDYAISQAVDRLEMGGIPFRVSDSGITPHMSKFFPLTPIEIHRGWILAHERLLTKYTGTYSWDHTVTGTLYRYDSNGGLVDQTYRSLSAAGGSIDVPPDGLAIFVRDDLPKTCYEAQQVGYGMQTDLNPDCYINWSDFSVFAGHWLFDQCGAAADFDGSCLVDWGDFSIFASTWLDCNDPQNVPPCTASW